MPSKSPAQAKLARIAAHTKGGYGGMPQAVGKEFEAADEARDHHEAAYADGGLMRSTATQRQALFKHRRNRAED